LADVLLFDRVPMVLDRVMHGGKDDDPKAYCYLSYEPDDDFKAALGIKAFMDSPWRDKTKVTPILTSPILNAFESGDLFKAKIESTTSRHVLANMDGAKLNSGSVKKGSIHLSILVPLKDWESFGKLVDAIDETVKVTFYPGAKQEELPLGEGDGEG